MGSCIGRDSEHSITAATHAGLLDGEPSMVTDGLGVGAGALDRGLLEALERNAGVLEQIVSRRDGWEQQKVLAY